MNRQCQRANLQKNTHKKEMKYHYKNSSLPEYENILYKEIRNRNYIDKLNSQYHKLKEDV